MSRAPIVTMRNGKLPISVASQVSPELFDRLQQHCRRTGALKAEFIRRAIEQRLEQFAERPHGDPETP